jgi:hypothetical protein
LQNWLKDAVVVSIILDAVEEEEIDISSARLPSFDSGSPP